MAKQLSPKQYIQTQARKLPVYKCYLSADWQQTKNATIIVTRRHTNGNFSAGIYMVDLFCLGIKDTFFLFNEPMDKLDEILNVKNLDLIEADYTLAHNIVYAAHDFAMEYGIRPHGDFQITKFVLAEDDDSVPFVDVPVGDDDGKPMLLVDSLAGYKLIIEKLEKNAGPGNYRVEVVDEMDTTDDDEDEENEYDNEDDEYDDEDDEILDFEHIAYISDDELNELISEKTRLTDLYVLDCEQLFRALNDEEPQTIKAKASVEGSDDFKRFLKGYDQWEAAFVLDEEKIGEVFHALKALGESKNGADENDQLEQFLDLYRQYEQFPEPAFLIFAAIPFPLVIRSLPFFATHLDDFLPSVQIMIAGYAAFAQKEFGQMQFIVNAPHVEMAYPFNKAIHAFHHKLFWLLKALKAVTTGNKEDIIYYHNLLRLVGTSGALRLLFAMKLRTWLATHLKIEGYEEE